jgi:putative ABC transport system ATP-binding protein
VTTAPVLEVAEVYRFFRSGEEETMALRGVSLSVAPGEFVAVVGPSGSGKSTLLACAAGLDNPAGGTVRVAGERMSHRNEIERSRLRATSIGMLLQAGNLIGHLDIAANIRLAGRIAGNRRVDVKALLGSVGLAHRGRAVPSELSGGEGARAGLAVALANRPPLLLADEPTGELDLESEAAVLELLRTHAQEGGGVLVVTHSQRVQDAADRVIRLADGRVAA